MSGGTVKASYSSVGVTVGTDWLVTCHTYPDRRPILAVDAGDLHLTISAAPEAPTGDHIDFAYKLLAAVNEYLIACEIHQLDSEEAENTTAEPADRPERRAA